MLAHFKTTFRQANVRRLYIGDFSFFLSFWIVYINLSWLTYNLTRSSFELGLLGFVMNISLPFILPFSGLLADAFDKRKILLTTQSCFLLVIIILLIITIVGKLNFPIIFVCSFLFGAIFASGFPATSSFVNDLVTEQADIQRAVGAIQTNSRTAQMLASAINGALHLIFSTAAVFGVVLLFVVNALWSFFRIDKHSQRIDWRTRHPLLVLKEGFSYTFSSIPMTLTVIFALFTIDFGNVYLFQLPNFVAKSLHGNIHTLSYIYIAGGFGAIMGAVINSSRKSPHGLMRFACLILGSFAIALSIFAFSKFLILSLIAAFTIGFSEVVAGAACVATLQLLAEPDKRGRVMGVYGFVVFGFIPFMNLLVGAIAKQFGIVITITSLACISFSYAIFYLIFLPKLRQRLQDTYRAQAVTVDNQPI